MAYYSRYVPIEAHYKVTEAGDNGIEFELPYEPNAVMVQRRDVNGNVDATNLKAEIDGEKVIVTETDTDFDADDVVTIIAFK